MNTSTIEILSPNRTVKLKRGGDTTEVTVRELSWLDQRQLLEKIQQQLTVFLAARQSGDETALASTILQLVLQSEDLVVEVLSDTTALTPEQVSQLSISETMGLLDVALDLNVTALMSGAKNVFGRIGKFRTNAAAGMTLTPMMPSSAQ